MKLSYQYTGRAKRNNSLTPDKILNSLVYRALFYVNIYGSHKLLERVRFFGPPCTLHNYQTNLLSPDPLDARALHSPWLPSPARAVHSHLMCCVCKWLDF